tara:strand:+ start:383 stop:940 length:558 start_codon:yes stop_codon:yes gene_type:complete
MAFITVAGNVTSYAEYTDILQKDQRLLEANAIKVPAESGFTDVTDFLEDLLTKSTDRINVKIKASAWWRSYLSYTGTVVSRPELTPDFNPNRILSRKQDFTDACVYYCLKEYLLPLIGDFSVEESQEVQKIRYYEAKFNDIFNELLAMADWYDADGDGIVEDSEKAYSYATVRRTRRRSTVVRVR